MKKMTSTKKIGIMAVFVSVGLVLQIVEDRIFVSPVPGGKLGLANVVTIVNIFMFGGANATAISGIRAFLGALLSGTAMAIPYSIAGAVASVVAMWMVKRFFYPRVSMVGMSVVGAVFHNAAQLVVASFFYGSVYVYSYFSGLLMLALISGTVTGYAASVFAKRVLKKAWLNE